MEQAESRLLQLLKNRGLRLTEERKLLLRQVLAFPGHFTMEELHAKLKQKNVALSRDTVFRNVPLLLEAGILQKSVGKEGRGEFFEVVARTGHHDHMICLQCERVIEFHSQALEDLQLALAKKHRFQMAFHDHRLYGYCNSCTR